MSAPAEYEGRHARPRQPGPAAAWLRRTARNLLWAAGDRLCARPLTFPAGNWLGELGWTLSGPFRLVSSRRRMSLWRT